MDQQDWLDVAAPATGREGSPLDLWLAAWPGFADHGQISAGVGAVLAGDLVAAARPR
jgi:predicted amino acid dehydrogenase